MQRNNNDTGVLSNYDFEKPVKSVARIIVLVAYPRKTNLVVVVAVCQNELPLNLFSAPTTHYNFASLQCDETLELCYSFNFLYGP